MIDNFYTKILYIIHPLDLNFSIKLGNFKKSYNENLENKK